jgi:hypothetical protein
MSNNLTMHQAGARIGKRLDEILTNPKAYLLVLTTRKQWNVITNVVERDIPQTLRIMLDCADQFEADPTLLPNLPWGWLLFIQQEGSNMKLFSNIKASKGRTSVLKSVLSNSQPIGPTMGAQQ